MDERPIAIQLKNVCKTYALFSNERQRARTMLLGKKPPATQRATNNFSLTIYKGESVAFFGPNGAGKSTLLKMITGVAYPTEGTIRVNGRVSALLELTAGFDGEMTGRQNIFFRGEILGVPRKEIKALEKDIIAFSELGQYIDQPVRTYSSGMKARLGFAINASVRPDILIVDEALSVGDKRFKEKCQEKISEVLAQGATFLFVTHSVSAALSFCKRGVVMHRGTVLFDGPVKEASDFYQKMIAKK